MKKTPTKPSRALRGSTRLGTQRATAPRARLDREAAQARAEYITAVTPEWTRQRDEFAKAALAGGFNEYLTASAWDSYDDFAASCFNMADAMMRERAKRQMARHADRVDAEWTTPKSGDGFKWDHVAIEVLMDIRAELRRMNGLLHCSNFVGIPTTLRAISRKIPTRRKVKR